MKKYYDKYGMEIGEGCVLYNPYDRDGEHWVISDGENLYLGDFDSPLEIYCPEKYWEILPKK